MVGLLLVNTYRDPNTRLPVTREEFYDEGKLHKEDGPALKCSDGSEAWYLNGVFHREDGPAISDSSGYKAWWVQGIRKRVEFPSGRVFQIV
jgi:hypothetical protein